MPAQPIATSACPSRHGRPKLSLTITAGRQAAGGGDLAPGCAEPRRRGRPAAAPPRRSPGTFEESMPALAQTRPLCGLGDQHAALGADAPSRSRRGSARPAPGPCRARRRARAPRRPGSTAARRADPPLGLGDDLLGDDDDVAVAQLGGARRSARPTPVAGAELAAGPVDREAARSRPRAPPRAADRGEGRRGSPARRRGLRPASAPAQGDEVRRPVSRSSASDGELVDRDSGRRPRAARRRVAIAAAGRRRRAGSRPAAPAAAPLVPVAVAVGDDRDVALRARPVSSRSSSPRVEQRAVAGQERRRRSAPARLRVGRSRAAPPRVAGVVGVGDHARRRRAPAISTAIAARR